MFIHFRRYRYIYFLIWNFYRSTHWYVILPLTITRENFAAIFCLRKRNVRAICCRSQTCSAVTCSKATRRCETNGTQRIDIAIRRMNARVVILCRGHAERLHHCQVAGPTATTRHNPPHHPSLLSHAWVVLAFIMPYVIALSRSTISRRRLFIC